MPAAIDLVPAGEVEPALLDWLAPQLERLFRARVRLAPALRMREEWYDPSRRQLRSDLLLDDLVSRSEPHTQATPWRVAITDRDLFVPQRDFVFGEATVGGCCAVVSTGRLLAPALSRPEEGWVRVLTEVVHELGHVAGLAHCDRASCVMAASEQVADVDRKGYRFCVLCRDRIDVSAHP